MSGSRHPASGRTVHLVVPGLATLLRDGADSAQRFPALERLCARADRVPQPDADVHRLILGLSGFETDPGRDAPVAALRRLGEGAAADGGWWMCADPVTLVAHRNQLALTALRPRLDHAERRSLLELIRGHFRQADWRLESYGNSGWYIRCETDQELRCRAPGDLLGHDVSGCQPGGGDARRWRSIVNEIQMLLHDCAENRERERNGLDPVNSLWLWGGGRLPTGTVPPWSMVWGGSALARGIAAIAGCASAADAVDALAGKPAVSGPVLALATDPGDRESVELSELERAWASPLLDALAAGAIEGIVLYPGTGHAYHLGAGMLRWRIWRNIGHLSEVMRHI